MQTQNIQSNQASTPSTPSFIQILRKTPADAGLLVQADGSVMLGDNVVTGVHARILSALVANGVEVTGRDLRLLVASGVYRGLKVDGNNGIHAFGLDQSKLSGTGLRDLARMAMQASYDAAAPDRRSDALVVEGKHGDMLAVLPNGGRAMVDGAMAPLVAAGGFYPGYFIEAGGKEGAARSFFVPLSFAEDVRDVAGARRAFGADIPMAYVQQAVERAEYNAYLAQQNQATVAEDVALNFLQGGGKLTLGTSF